MNIIKNYLFWRKYRWYRKDEMTTEFVKHRLFARKATKQITYRDELIELLKEQNKTKDRIINFFQNMEKFNNKI